MKNVRKKAATILFFGLFAFQGAIGHPVKKETVVKPLRYDSNYIFDYKHLITARLYGLIQDTRLVLRQDQSGDIIFKPNLPFKIGIAGFYKWLGLGLSVYSPFSFIDEDKNGETKAIDLRVNLYSNVFAVEAQLQRFRGMYISNFPGYGGNHFTNQGMVVYSGGATGYYIHNYRRFSFRSAYFQNEWQKKSAGSFVGRLGINVTVMDAKGGIIPEKFITMYGFDSLKNYSSSTLVSVSLAPGYAYNLVVLKQCYIHAGLFAGPSYNSMSEKSISTNNRGDVVSLLFSFRGAIGYNGPKFHAGFSAILAGYQPLASQKYNFYFDSPQFRIWAGTRFDLFKKKHKKKVVLLDPENQ